MSLPARRKPKPSGIDRGPKRRWPKHEKWVRGHDCSVQSPLCKWDIEFAHVRQGFAAGTGIKPPSWQGISLCGYHHAMQHRMGHETFDRLHGIDSMKLAAEFASHSPDREMIDAMKEQS